MATKFMVAICFGGVVNLARLTELTLLGTHKAIILVEYHQLRKKLKNGIYTVRSTSSVRSYWCVLCSNTITTESARYRETKGAMQRIQDHVEKHFNEMVREINVKESTRTNLSEVLQEKPEQPSSGDTPLEPGERP